MTGWQASPYTIPFALTSLLCVVVALVAWRRRPAPGAAELVWLLVSCAQWSFVTALQWASADLSDQVFWFRMRFLGTQGVCVSSLVFALRYGGRTWLTRRRLAALLVLPAALLTLLCFDDWLHWFVRDARLDYSEAFGALVVSRGPAYWVNAAYGYALVLTSQFLVVHALFRSPSVYRVQVIAVGIAVLAPFLANVVFLSGRSPFPHVGLTPFAFSISGAAFVAALFRFRLLDILPAARHTVLEHLSDAVFILDERQRIADLNPAARNILGRKAADAFGLPIENVLPEAARLFVKDGDSGTGAMHNGEISLPAMVDGHEESTRDYDLRVSPVRDDGGRVTGTVLLLHDITEDKKTRETLRQSEETYRTILEGIEDGYYELDLAGNVVNLTDATAEMFGVPREEAPGRNFTSWIDESAAKGLFEIYNRVYRTGQAVKNLEYHLTTSGGVEKSLEASASLVRDADGKPIGFRGILRDVTERKLAEVELQKAKEAAEAASRAKGAFLATVSHELRTPLTSVLGFAKLIKRRMTEVVGPAVSDAEANVKRAAKQVTANIDIIVSEGERLTALINDVLDLAKIESGKVEWHMQPVAVGEIVERAIAATTSLSGAKGLEMRTEISDALPTVEGDPDRLIQVVINLLSNAIKFTDQGAITCRARLNGEAIEVSVTDTGAGIAPEDQTKVFEQFMQVGDTLTGKPTGTGLGLPICKQIIGHHGGRIWVESEIGRGSTFSFTLPARMPDEMAAPPVDSPPVRRVGLNALVDQLRQRVVGRDGSDGTRGKSILVVDDDRSIRSLLRQELEAQGYHVREAEDGETALASVRRERPDLIILDVMMPGLSGFDVAAVLRNDPTTAQIPIVILSVIQDEERGLRVGVDHYFTKPVNAETLLHEVGNLLAQGPTTKKVLVVDEDAETVRTLSTALVAQGYIVTRADSGKEAIEKAVNDHPDLVMVRSLVSEQCDLVQTLRFEKGMESVSFVLFE
jgi:PAS domain S-box-containing protein